MRCLSEFAFRGVNLTKIESRPLRGRLGHYLFHVDMEGRVDEPSVADAVSALDAHCEEVRAPGHLSGGLNPPDLPARVLYTSAQIFPWGG